MWGLLRVAAYGLLACTASAQVRGSLKWIQAPAVPGLDRYVRDERILVVLGKALFWDMQVGSDGRTACATCHFHAGADHRVRNQVSDTHASFSANHVLVSQDFPVRDSSRRVGSMGVFRRIFQGLSDSNAAEQGVDGFDLPWFRVGELNLRQVTLRNTPTVINAIFNVRNFRDGRASEIFTGRTPFGDSDPGLNLIAAKNGALVREAVRLENSSLASLAVAPPVNTTEMSYEGRTWTEIARKLLDRRVLAMQRIAVDDSVLGEFAGLDVTYRTLIARAFLPEYLAAAEFNFPFFFGVAIQGYLATLVSDDSRFDQFAEGHMSALTPEEMDGLLLFQGNGMCMFCHAGAETTNASYSFAAGRGSIDSVLTRARGTLETLFADIGFVNTGVRPAADDAGLDGIDSFGFSFSTAVRKGTNALAVNGAFKVPGLRNVEFSGPYFHNGGQATLDQVVEFYNRGGDFPDSTGVPVQIAHLELNDGERRKIVAFLKALSDDRVRFERAPFDHPELCVPVGYAESPAADAQFPQSASDRWAGIPAVGRGGNSAPLQTFEEMLIGVGRDGSRTHTLSEPCGIPFQ